MFDKQIWGEFTKDSSKVKFLKNNLLEIFERSFFFRKKNIINKNVEKIQNETFSASSEVLWLSGEF